MAEGASKDNKRFDTGEVAQKHLDGVGHAGAKKDSAPPTMPKGYGK